MQLVIVSRGLGPRSVLYQLFVPFLVQTYNRGPIHAGFTDLEVSPGTETAKGSVKTVSGSYFGHIGLSLGL